jgi:AAA15 family ATPase/GTPase
VIFSRGGKKMLLNFRFENFKSFENLAEFSMVTGKAKLHEQNFYKANKFNYLKFSAMYGPNAGGKSSFVDAIGISQAMILSDLNVVATKDKYNKNNPENMSKPTSFEYEILLDNKIYTYGFSMLMNKKRVISEYLLDITNAKTLDDGIEIFIRSEENGIQYINVNFDYLCVDKNTETRINVYMEDLESTTLFLKSLNTKKKTIKSKLSKETILEDIFNWFENTLEVISPDGTTKSYNLTYLDEEYLLTLGEYLQAFDTGVRKVRFERSTEEALKIPVKIREKVLEKITLDIKKDNDTGVLIRTNSNIFRIELEDEEELRIDEIRFVHNSDTISYSLEEESDGTRRIIDIFTILLGENDKVYIIDELDRSLHPNLTYNFVQQFLMNTSNSQLIVTTHEDRLLDLNLLRRDQIWFVERNETGNSELYSLEEYKVRFDKDILKEYLSGRYGSVPKFNFLFDVM